MCRTFLQHLIKIHNLIWILFLFFVLLIEINDNKPSILRSKLKKRVHLSKLKPNSLNNYFKDVIDLLVQIIPDSWKFLS